MFSHTDAREDELPLFYLHSEECWERSGHKCPDNPLIENDNSDADDGFVLDYDYNPTKHSMLEWVIMGGLRAATQPGQCWIS